MLRIQPTLATWAFRPLPLTTLLIASLIAPAWAERDTLTADQALRQLQASGATVSVFSRDRQNLVETELATGPVTRQGSRNRPHYRFEQTRLATGIRETLTLDFSTPETPLSVARLLQATASSQGYQTLYACQGVSCGEAMGWQLLLSDLNQGSDATQSYRLLARQPLATTYREYLQLYWNQTGCCTRLTLRKVVTDTGSPQGSTGWLAQPGAPLILAYFNRGSSRLSSTYGELIDDLAYTLVHTQASQQVILTGHTDGEGKQATNQKLARNRAEAVLARLHQTGVDLSRHHIRIAKPGADAGKDAGVENMDIRAANHHPATRIPTDPADRYVSARIWPEDSVTDEQATPTQAHP